MEFKDLEKLVLEWAKNKDLLHEENAEKQFLKFMEEVFEFRDEWLLYINYCNKHDYSESYVDMEITKYIRNMVCEMGDIFVTLIILCDQLNMDPINCLARAYEKIKDRKGKTINGIFVKEEDLKDVEEWKTHWEI